MAELTFENRAGGTTAAEGDPAADPPPPPPPPAHPRRPRVREVSSRFMSPLVSSSSSAESPHHHHHHHHVAAKSPIHSHRHNLGSTPIPSHHPSDPHSRPRSSSANRRRRQLDMEQTLHDSDPPPPPPPPTSETQFHFEQVPSSTLRRQRSAKLMKENVAGNRQTPMPNHPPPSKRGGAGAGGQPRADTPMLSASLDRTMSVQSRFRGTQQRSNDNNSAASSAAARLLQSTAMSSSTRDSDCHENNAHLSSSTQSLPELLDPGRAKTGNRASNDSLKLSAFPSSRYLNSPFSSVDGGAGAGAGDRLPGKGLCLPPPVPPCPGAETRKAKKVSSHQDDFTSLKLLQNRYLQWRYSNARAEASAQALERETRTKVNSLRVKMSEMYDSVAKKRTELGILRRTHTLSSILEAQVPCLDQWSDLEGDYSVSLAETIQALLNASIQLPLGGNVRVDVKELQESLNSAMKVMESMVSSVQHLMPKATETEILVSELAKIVGGERALVEECGDLLYKTQALQVDECSLRCQIIQLHTEKCFA